MNTELLIFVSQFAVVFLLGFQSQSVRDNRYVRACVGSSLIGAAQLFQWRLMPKATNSEMLVWWLAGPLAIALSMAFYNRLFRRDKPLTKPNN